MSVRPEPRLVLGPLASCRLGAIGRRYYIPTACVSTAVAAEARLPRGCSCHDGGEIAGASAATARRCSVNVAPPWGALSTDTVPLIPSGSSFTRASPTPLPLP